MKFEFKTLFKKGPRPLVGIDIGSHTIKLVEFSGNEAQRMLRRIGRALVPRGAIVDGAVREPKALEETLKALIRNCQPRIRRVATSVSGYSVIIKRISVPYDDIKAIEENLIFEAENYVPFEIEEVYLDFNIIGNPKTQKGRPGSEIFLVAAKRQVVDAYSDIIQNAGLRPAVVDVDGFAIGNAFEGAMRKMDNNIVLIDLGASKSTFGILKGSMPLFTRDIAMGGAQLTQAIADATGMGISEAERIKIAGTKDPVLARDISQTIKEVVTGWGQEVKKAIEFFKSNSRPEEFPETIYMSGGSALIRGIGDIFEDITGLESRSFDPFKGMKKDVKIDKDYLHAVAPQFGVAAGLALRSEEL